MRISSNPSKPMSPRMRFFFARLFPLPFLIVGALVLYFGGRGMYRAHESLNWPEAEGRIQNSIVEYHRSDDGGGTYHAEIRYTFFVAGQKRSGNVVSFGDYGSSSSSHAQNIVNRYPVETPVLVRYMPNDPDVCVLEPGIKIQTWFLPAFGLIFFTAGAVMAVSLPNAMK